MESKCVFEVTEMSYTLQVSTSIEKLQRAAIARLQNKIKTRTTLVSIVVKRKG